MMEDTERRLRQSFENLERALSRLEEALHVERKNSLMVDGTIHRFEFTIDMYWKMLKRLLQSEGIDSETPRECLKEAYQAGWLADEKAWLQMLKDRNETPHVYDEEMALRIVGSIQQYLPEMKAIFLRLRERIG